MDDLSDIGGIIEDFAAPYTVSRAGAIDFTTTPGFPLAGTPTAIPITAVVQPVRNKDLQRLPEGLRTDQLRAVFTETQLQTEPQPDTIVIDGLSWQVESVEPWESGGFWKAIVRKVGA